MTTPITHARPSTRDKIFWSLIAALALGQLIAFWMLCTEQVRRAQTREVTMQVDRVGVADCMRANPKSTRHKCAERPAVEQNLLLAARDRRDRDEQVPSTHAAARSAMSGATPASLMLR